jgi:ABC-type nitrate/sulfonate/bicarbonate transport system substrate-binding protein
MPESRSIRAVLMSVAIVGIALLCICCQTGTGGTYTGPVEKITLGVVAIESSSLVYIAAARGMFKEHGLDVTLIDFPDGVKASDDLLKNRVDVAAVADFIFVTRSFKRNDLRIFGSIFRGDTFEIIARKDRGITEPAHLKGRRIGLTRGTVLDFFMETFLSRHGISSGSVRLVDMKPSEIPEAISSGAVDAVYAWEPYAGEIKKSLGPNAVIWPGQSDQSYQFVLMTKEEFIKERPIAVERLLKALLAAEKYCSEHAADAQNIIASRRGYDPALLQSVWKRSDFRVRLDQNLVILMEDQAKWAMRRRLTEKRDMPNYINLIHLQSLERIKPEAVRIIH